MTDRFFTLSVKMLAVSLALLLMAGAATAGGIINKQNQSADYMRTLNRNAATDYADIAAYNPAGIMQMADGFYGKLDLMYIDKDYSNTVPGFGKLDQDEPSILPGIFTVYKQEKVAGFFAVTIPAGGGNLDYQNGNARTVALASGIAAAFNAGLAANNVPDAFFYNQIDAGRLEVKQSSVYGFTLGTSFAVNDAWSLAVGARYATGTREFDGQAGISAANPFPGVNEPVTARLHLDEEAQGWAGILGVNYAPDDRLNAALTFITKTKMNYKVNVKEDTLGIAPGLGLADGSRRRIDIPGLLGFGISYRFLPELKVDLNYTYYLEKQATIDTFGGEGGDSWDLGLSAEYTFNPQWKASVGYMMTDIKLSADQQINEPEEPKLDANSFAAGVVWSATPALDVTAGGAYIIYDDVTDVRGINYDKTVWAASIGFQYRFF